MVATSATTPWRLLAQLFARPLMATAAQEGSPRVFHQALRAAGVRATKDEPLGSVLDECMGRLQRHYRCEYVYKAAVADRVVFGRHSPRTASLHVELPVGRSIVDLAVFNGTSTAYEIKTEFDSEKRLASQASTYLKAFEHVYVVCHPDRVERCLRVSDPAVGVLALTRRGQLATVRPAIASRDRMDRSLLFRLLRASEYQAAVERLCGTQPDMPNGKRFSHYSRVWETLTLDQAHQAVVAAMRRRTTQSSVSEFVSALPKSLRVLGYATPLSAPQQQRLLNILH